MPLYQVIEQEDKTKVLDEITTGSRNQGGLLGTALGVDEDGYLCVYKEEGATDDITYSISDDGYLEISYAAG